MKSILAVTTAIGMLASGIASAAAFPCSATISNINIYYNGDVVVKQSLAPDFTQVCNLNSAWKDVSPTTCAMWTSVLETQKRAGQPATFYYDTSLASSCATLPAYNLAPAPFYIGVSS